jgi:hypothetical protein
MPLLLAWGQARADALVPDRVVGLAERMEHLEIMLLSDCGYPANQLWKLDKAKKEISTRREYKPLLLAQFQAEYFGTPLPPGLSGARGGFYFLSMRKDLTAAEQKIITDELARRSEVPGDKMFVNPAIYLLRHYPSAEHEELILRFLQDGWPDRTVKAAFEVLYESGTEKSLPVMREALARMQKQSATHDLSYLEDMTRYLEGLEYRLAKAAQAKAVRKPGR